VSTVEATGTQSYLTERELPGGPGDLLAPSRGSYADSDKATLLGLYHGYDQARLALARVVSRYGAEAPSNEETRRRIFGRARRAGFAEDLFSPEAPPVGSLQGINEGAHSAALTAFAAVSDQAEGLLRELRSRWPELCEDAGGPLPAPPPGWDD